MARQKHTPAEKAQAALDISGRKLTALRTKRDALAKEAKALDAAIVEEGAQHAYLAQNPALAKATAAPKSVSSVRPAADGVLMNDDSPS